MTVRDKATSELLAASESTTLDTEAFSISADVDQSTGAGSLIIGEKTYVIHEDPTVSGGITCVRLYNDQEFFVSCDINVPVSSKIRARAPVARETENLAVLPGILDKMMKGGDPTPAFDGNMTQPAGDVDMLDKRQGACGIWSQTTRRVGGGNPHQNYFLKQLSQNINCGAATQCGVGESSSRSYTIGWSASAEAWQWLSGGFDVGTSWETGREYTCTASSRETLCLWYNTAHTAYTVQNGMHNPCTGTQNSGGPYVMFSPNRRNQGGGYYCVVGTCRNQGDNYWDYNGRAGEP
ncbi:hypothetical protein F5883DRAFT_486721 [Diaporthe sp. PMI_573]|nr:hypothetical protein F5883DRAFT_486721 [Diaporthaceae sp. PMI_573]